MAAPHLPEWREGTVAILSTVDAGTPHAIPISTAVRAGPCRVLFALAHSRGSLGRLHADARGALTLVGVGDVAFTARGRAAVVAESIGPAGNVAAVALEVEHVEEHGRPEFEILDGVRWRWLDEASRQQDAQVRAALRELARGR